MSEPPAAVDIRLLGVPRWSSRSHASRPLSARDAALFALLALDGETARDRVAAWLWPESTLKGANLNLRQHLFKLRRLCGHALVDAGPTLRLAAGVAVDLRDEPDPGEGELLAGMDYPDHGEFGGWLVKARQRCARQHVERLGTQAAQLEARHELAAAIMLAERLVQAEPLAEHGWRRLMRLHYRRGDRAAAVQAFERCEQVLRHEQGLRPSAETLALLQTVEQLPTPAPPPALLPAALLHPPRMVGRDGALRALHQAWQLGRPALVLGEGGIGKTRLLQEFMHQLPPEQQAQHQPHRVRAGEAASPYATVALLLHQTLQRFAPALDADTRSELARLLPYLGTPPPGHAVQALLWQAVEAGLAAAVQAGLAGLVIDDLHQADAASLELLRWLAGGASSLGLRLVLAARANEPDPVATLAGWTADASSIECIELRALDLAHLGELLRSLPLGLEADEVDARAAALHRHAGGHPYYTLETLKYALRQGSDPWLLAAPPGVRTLIDRSLRRLPEPAVELAALLALMGSAWNAEAGAAVLRRPMRDVVRAWGLLEAAQLTQGHDFAHDLVRERALALLPTPWQRVMHERVAERMAQSPATDVQALARHWVAAERWPEAAAALRRAAAHAAAAGRLAEQEALLDQAAEAYRRAGQAADRFEALADAATAAMMRSGDSTVARRLQTLDDLAVDAHRQARVALLHAEQHLNAARLDEALACCQQALLRAAPDSDARHDAQVLRGRTLAMMGQAEAAIAPLQQTADAAAARGRPDQEVSARGGLAHALHAAGRLGQAVQQQRSVLALTQTRGQRAEIADAANNLASMAYAAGESDLSLQAGHMAEALFDAMGARGIHRLWNQIMLARVEAAAGRFDQALQRLQLLDGPGAAAVGPTVRTLGHVTRSAVLLTLGRCREALAELPADDAAAMPVARARSLALKARLQALLGAHDAASLAALQRLADEHAALRDDGVLVLDWSEPLGVEEALPWLQRLAERASAMGADGLSRSLQLCALGRRLAIDRAGSAAGAQALLPILRQGLGLHAATCPADAWATLSAALDGQAAADCALRANAWLAQARLPGAANAAQRLAFLKAHPVPRVAA